MANLGRFGIKVKGEKEIMEKLSKIFQKLIFWLSPLAFCIVIISFKDYTIDALEIIVICTTALYYIAMITSLIIRVIKRRKMK